MTLHYQQQGQGSDIVLLHGWGFNSQIWQPVLPQLCQHFRVTLIDLPGMGKSSLCDRDYDAETISEHLLAVAPAQALWVGWSLGGLLALQVAALEPARVQGLAMVASSPCFVQQSDWPGIETAVLHQFAEQLQQDHQALLQDFLALHLRGVSDRSMLQSLRESVLQYGTVDPGALQAGLAVLQQWDLRAEFSNINCPTMHVLGRLDSLVPTQVAPAIQQLHGQAQVQVLQRSAHVPFLTESEKFCMLLRELSHECGC